MDEGRWTTVTPSEFPHEREALAFVKALLPSAEPYRAWSNLSFTADTGHVREVDLLVAAPAGLFVIEIKSLHGRLTASGSNWVVGRGRRERVFDNPLHLADAKAKQLKSLLIRAANQRGVRERVPYVQVAVFLSVPDLKVDLPEHHLHRVFGRDGRDGLPEIGRDLLLRPPSDDRRRLTPSFSRQLGGLLDAVGIARSSKYYDVGSWRLDPRPFDQGPTWQDHEATHKQLSSEKRRVRIYLVELNADAELRASIVRAARREMQVLHGVGHPGIVQVDDMQEHAIGPALVFRYDPRAMRLDHYMAQYGDRLDLDARLGMVRQLAEALAYAHRKQLHHRALSARSVLVVPDHQRDVADDGWLRPSLQVSDWQAAFRDPSATVGSAIASMPGGSKVASHVARHLEAAAEPYLAPELSTPEPDPVALDVFGLGTIAYLLLTNRPPAESRSDLRTRLAEENGIRPSALSDSITESMDELVQLATAPVPGDRPSSVAEFLELLETVEDEVTTPAATLSEHAEPAPEEVDPLQARPGELIGGGEWKVEKRLGTGSTSRVLLVENLRTEQREVLKVALSDEKATRLEHEASVLRKLQNDARVIGLARDHPVQIGGRIAIVLDHVGSETVARKIREGGRLSIDELDQYGEYLFGAIDFLEGEGVTHRDIKPDNIAIRVRKNRSRQLVLFDFSLAGIPVQQIEAGTTGYLDPFLGSAERPVYDGSAEWYAIAVTLHEMASGERPIWGDGATEPHFTEGPPVLATEAFDPAIRDDLVEFFQRALHRDARQRFGSLREVKNAWQLIFLRSDAAPPVGSEHPGELPPEEVSPQDVRNEAARAATSETALDAAGLSQRAVSAATRLEAATVGDLLQLPSKRLFNLPGVGAKTRKELHDRIREWRRRLQSGEPSPLRPEERRTAAAEIKAATDGEVARAGLDTLVPLLVPALQSNGRNATEVEATRLLLGLPDDAGRPSPLPMWPKQRDVGAALDPPVTSARVGQVLADQRKRWRGDPHVGGVLDEVVDLLEDCGRVAGARELAERILVTRGCSRDDGGLRLAIAMAAVRAAVESDAAGSEPRLATRRHSDPTLGNRLIIALEVAEDDAPDTPAAPALLDDADALGKVADRLAEQEVLPAPAAVLRALREVQGHGVPASLDDARLVSMAAGASKNAAATARLEIYPRDLDPVRALRLSQAGVVPPGVAHLPTASLRPEQIHERVQARFPALAPLPGHPRLEALLRAAGFELRWNGVGYVSPHVDTASSGTRFSRGQTRSGDSRWTAGSPELAEALRAEERVDSATSGFRALTVQLRLCEPARRELVTRFEAEPLDLAALFLRSLRGQITPGTKPTWETILKADAAGPGSTSASRLEAYIDRAWADAAPQMVVARSGTGRPLLLHNAAVCARYRATDLLFELAEAARAGGRAVWLLCPMHDPGQPPKVDGALTPAQLPNEWVTLTDAWVKNEHRSEARVS